MNIAHTLSPFVLAGLLASTQASGQPVTLHHVHGLAFSADGKALMVPSHFGLAVYADGRWSIAPGPRHDYMGFSATRKRMYSSGHPAPGSPLVNPFGLIRSDDGGRDWKQLGLEGESDFHVLATSYETNVVYVHNPAPNSRMRSPGIYFTLDDGTMWLAAVADGLAGGVRALAVHPTDYKTVAAATSAGLFVSESAGERFKPIATAGEILAVAFDLDARTLWFSAHDGRPRLARHDLKRASRIDVATPVPANDAIAYIAQNPAARNEYAIATFERSVYLTADGGKSWRQIAERGRTF